MNIRLKRILTGNSGMFQSDESYELSGTDRKVNISQSPSKKDESVMNSDMKDDTKATKDE